MAQPARRMPNQFALSIFWFAWELHWSALLGAAMQAQVARFIAPGGIGTATAIMSGAGAFFSIAAQYAAGRASDAAGRRIPYLIAGTLADVIAVFGFALAPSFVTVVLAFVAVQISLNTAGGPYQALIPDKVPANLLGRASAIMAFYRLVGIASGLLLAKKLVVQPDPGVTAAALTHGLLSLAIVVSIVLVASLAVTVAGVRDEKAAANVSEPAPDSWRDRSSFTWLVVSRSLVSMGLYLILPFFAFFLRFALGIPKYLSTSLTLLLIINAFSLIGLVPAYLLGDRVSKKSIMFVAMGLLAIGAILFANMKTSAAGPLEATAILVGIGWGAYYAVDWALACTLLPKGRAGALMAIWNIGSSGPQVLSPTIGGLLADRIGAATGDLGNGYRLLFAFIALYVLLGGVALAFVRERRGGKEARAE